MVERAQQIATGVSRHLSALIARSKNSQQIQALTDFSMRANGDACMAFLQGIHVMRVHDHTEQLAAVANLSNLVKKNPKVKLIVIDSVAFHFRHGSSSVDFAKRSRLLAGMSQKLNELAHKSNLAVVLINQMTTKVDDGGGGGGRLVPALGETWAHAATHRVQLYWASDAVTSGERKAKLIKSSSKAQKTVSYTITKLGIRDAKTAPSSDTPQQQQLQQQQPHQSHENIRNRSSFTPRENLMFSPHQPLTSEDGQGHPNPGDDIQDGTKRHKT